MGTLSERKRGHAGDKGDRGTLSKKKEGQGHLIAVAGDLLVGLAVGDAVRFEELPALDQPHVTSATRI